MITTYGKDEWVKTYNTYEEYVESEDYIAPSTDNLAVGGYKLGNVTRGKDNVRLGDEVSYV